MRKTCVQPVPAAWVTAPDSQLLPTSSLPRTLAPWTNHSLSPLVVHTICMQLPTAQNDQITDGNRRLYTLSTPPIIRAKKVNKENNSLGTRG
jgi:hypothetical protein